jgi:hypothetical protein
MPAQNTQLRKQIFGKQDLGDHARDTQQALNTIPRFFTQTLEAYYAEPMVLGSPVAGVEPESVELVRITSIVTPEQPVLCGSMVHYTWKPQNNGCQVTSIDGLTPSNTIKYRFTFRFSFPAKGTL